MFVVNGIVIGFGLAGVLMGVLRGYPLLALASLLCLLYSVFTTVRGLRRTHVEVR